MTAALAIEIALVAVGGAVAVTAAWMKHKRDSVLCNSCAELIKSGGGGAWKYYCNKDIRGFDKPPKYCKHYKERTDEKG